MKYKSIITAYCESHSINIPPGFYRNTASPLVVIRTDFEPSKLVAKTFLNHADLIYYIEKFVIPEVGDPNDLPIQILDFKNDQQLIYDGSKKMKHGQPIK